MQIVLPSYTLLSISCYCSLLNRCQLYLFKKGEKYQDSVKVEFDSLSSSFNYRKVINKLQGIVVAKAANK